MTCYIVCYIMPVLKRLNQYLKWRDGFWSFNRRVPLADKDLDTRGTIRTALATSSIEVARARRDALAAADEAFRMRGARQPFHPFGIDPSSPRGGAAR